MFKSIHDVTNQRKAVGISQDDPAGRHINSIGQAASLPSSAQKDDADVEIHGLGLFSCPGHGKSMEEVSNDSTLNTSCELCSNRCHRCYKNFITA